MPCNLPTLVEDMVKKIKPIVLQKIPKDDVQDVLQDIRLSLWISLPKYRGDAKIETYAAVVAKFRIVDFYRKRKQQKKAIEAAKEITPPVENILKSDFYWLSRREKDVLYLVSLGLSNDQIAEKLFVSKYTVRTHLQHLYQKLSCPTRELLVVFGKEIFEGDKE